MSEVFLSKLREASSSFEITQGKDAIVILGPPGSGKTSSFKLIAENSQFDSKTCESESEILNFCFLINKDQTLFDTFGIDFESQSEKGPILAFILWNILRKFERIKFLLVVSQSDLDSKYGKALGEMWNSLISHFSNSEEINKNILEEDALFFIVNKVSEDRNGVLKLLENMKKKENSDTTLVLIDYLLTTKHIFTIPPHGIKKDFKGDQFICEEIENSCFMSLKSFKPSLNCPKNMCKKLLGIPEILVQNIYESLKSYIKDFLSQFKSFPDFETKLNLESRKSSNITEATQESEIKLKSVGDILESSLIQSLNEDEELIQFRHLTIFNALNSIIKKSALGIDNNCLKILIKLINDELIDNGPMTLGLIKRDLRILLFIEEVDKNNSTRYKWEIDGKISDKLYEDLRQFVGILLNSTSIYWVDEQNKRKEKEHKGSKQYFRGIIKSVENTFDYIREVFCKNEISIKELQQLLFNCNYHLAKIYISHHKNNKKKQAILSLLAGFRKVEFTEEFPVGQSRAYIKLWNIFLENSEYFKQLSEKNMEFFTEKDSRKKNWPFSLNEVNVDHLVKKLREKFIHVLKAEIDGTNKIIQELVLNPMGDPEHAELKINNIFEFYNQIIEFNKDPLKNIMTLRNLVKEDSLKKFANLIKICTENFPETSSVIILNLNPIIEELKRLFMELIYIPFLDSDFIDSDLIVGNRRNRNSGRNSPISMKEGKNSLLLILKSLTDDILHDEELKAILLYMEGAFGCESNDERISKLIKLNDICSQNKSELETERHFFHKKSQFFKEGLQEDALYHLIGCLLQKETKGNMDRPQQIAIYEQPYEYLIPQNYPLKDIMGHILASIEKIVIESLPKFIRTLHLGELSNSDPKTQIQMLTLVELWINLLFSPLNEVNLSELKFPELLDPELILDPRDVVYKQHLNLEPPFWVNYSLVLLNFFQKNYIFLGSYSFDVVLSKIINKQHLADIGHHFFSELMAIADSELDLSQNQAFLKSVKNFLKNIVPWIFEIIKKSEILELAIKIDLKLVDLMKSECEQELLEAYKHIFESIAKLLREYRNTDWENSVSNQSSLAKTEFFNNLYFKIGNDFGNLLLKTQKYEQAIIVFKRIRSLRMLKVSFNHYLENLAKQDQKDSLKVCRIVAETFFRMNIFDKAFECYHKLFEKCNKNPLFVSEIYKNLADLDRRRNAGGDYFEQKGQNIGDTYVIYSDEDIN